MTRDQANLLAVLEERPGLGFDAVELAGWLGTTPSGACRIANNLVRLGLVDRFVGGVGRQREHWQARDIEAELEDAAT